MHNRIPVMIHAIDRLSAAGLRAQLIDDLSVEIVGPADYFRARVAVLAGDSVDSGLIKMVRLLRQEYQVEVIVIAATFDEEAVVEAVAAGAGAFLRRRDTTSNLLVETIRTTLQGSGLPEGLARRLGGTGQPTHAETAGDSHTDSDCSTAKSGHALLVTAREAQILRLVADGYDTAEVASQMSYSESSIKGYIAKMMDRFSARNRCHVLAIALERGLI